MVEHTKARLVRLYTSVFFAATFDAKTVYTPASAPKFGSGYQTLNQDKVGVQNIPSLNHLTLCLWTKFPQTSVTGFLHNILASYYDSEVSTIARKGFGLSFTNRDGAEATYISRGTFFIRSNGTDKYVNKRFF